MKFNIKSLLTGTTLVAASTCNLTAVLPKEVEFVPGETVPHPVFGKMKVISHRKDIEYYNRMAKNPNDTKELVEKFVNYVINEASFTDGDCGISKDYILAALHCMTKTRVGRAALKVITANYMRECGWYKKFLSEYHDVLQEYCEICESSRNEKIIVCYDLKQELRRLYDDRIKKIQDDIWKRCEIKKEQFRSLYTYFSKREISKQDNADDANDFPFDEADKAEYVFFEQFYQEHKDMLKKYCDMCEELKGTKKSEEIRDLKEYRKRLKEKLEKIYEDEAKSISIRERMVRAEDLLKLYEHSEQINSEPGDTRNTLLLRKLSFSSDGKQSRFIPDEMKINLNGLEKSENFYVNAYDNFIDRDDSEDKNNEETIPGKYSALQHEIIHFMQNVIFSDYSKKEHTHKIENIIAKSKNTLLQGFAQYCRDIAPSVKLNLPHKIYDVTGDMLCMYGIIWDDDKDTFYYDPINEAVADAECKIFKGEKQQLVRTGHGTIKDAELLSKLNEEKKIYKFYFNKNLRALIPE